MSVNHVKGINQVIASLRKNQAKHAKRLEQGLYKAGFFLQRESQKIVPVEYGILKGTANTRKEGQGLETAVIVSYGTDYAVYVHEMVENQHKPGKSAKFLEIPLREKRQRMQQIITDHMSKGAGS